MSTEHLQVRGLTISVDEINVRSSNGTIHHYLRARLPMGIDPFTHRSRPAKPITAKTKEELRRKILQTMDIRMRLNGVGESEVTVEEWCNYYLEHYLEGAPSTQKTIRLTCKNHIIPYLGSVYLQELTEMQVEDFRDHLLKERGYSPGTVSNTLYILNMILDRAVHSRTIPLNPAAMVRKPKKRYKKKVILDKEQMAAFLEELPHDRYGNLFGLLATTGFRVGEGMGLADSRVDFARRKITVNQHVVSVEEDHRTRTVLASSTKTGIDRSITVPRQAMEYVEAELKERKLRATEARGAWNNPHDLVFASSRGDILRYPTIEKHLKSVGARIGRPDLTPHVLRHTAATILYLRSHNIIWVRDMLGHQNLATTERYIHVSTEDLMTIPQNHSRAMERLGSSRVPVDLDFESLAF